jgi:hypothetical protein
MNFRHAMMLGACLTLVPAAFASADTAPNYPRPPKPDFTSMRFLIGTWSCSTKSARRPTAVMSTDTWSMDPSGYYLVQKSFSKGSPWYPYAGTSTDMYTYDSQIKQWADQTTSTLGGYGLSMSKGWIGNKLVWHPVNNTPYLDVASTSDYTLTKVSPTKVVGVSSFSTKSGRTVGVTYSCSKSS